LKGKTTFVVLTSAMATMSLTLQVHAQPPGDSLDARDAACFDLAVVTKPPTETEIPNSSPPGDLLGHPKWRLQMTIEQTLIGTALRDVVETVVVKHTRFNPQITHHLTLLRSKADGTYEDVGGDYMVIQDKQGRFIIPLAEPRSDDWLFPNGPMPPAYESLLKPVDYFPRAAWWLNDASDRELAELDPAWARASGKRIIALRGLYLDDWAQAMRAERGAVCAA
jgi:hypothetical protein